MKGFRVLAFNVAAFVLTALIGYNWADSLPAGYGWASGVIITVLNFALRFVTTTPVGQKD